MRQKRLTEPRKANFIQAIARGLKPTSASAVAGVSHATCYRWRAEDDAFRDAWEAAELGAVEQVEEKLYEMAMDKDLGAVTTFLRANKPDKYNRKHVTLAGDAAAPLNGTVWLIPPRSEGDDAG